jgi:hypothetical protein
VTPGQRIYEMVRESGATIASVPDWFGLASSEQEVWEHAARSVIDAEPKREKLPDCYIDALPYAMEMSQDLMTDVTDITIKLKVPAVEARNARSGSTISLLRDIDTAVKDRTHKLRLALFTDAQIQSEFSRLDRDGTVRELLENECTW